MVLIQHFFEPRIEETFKDGLVSLRNFPIKFCISKKVRAVEELWLVFGDIHSQ